MRVAPLWLLVMVAPGCGGPVREELTLDQLCAVGNAGQGEETFAVGQSVRLSVGVDVLQHCRPLCDAPVSSHCAYTREGNTFHVTGAITVDVDCHGTTPPPACSAPTVECVTDPLPAGEYTVTDGTRTLNFRVPSTLVRASACSP